MQKAAAGEMFTEAQQKKEHWGFWGMLKNFGAVICKIDGTLEINF